MPLSNMHYLDLSGISATPGKKSRELSRKISFCRNFPQKTDFSFWKFCSETTTHIDSILTSAIARVSVILHGKNTRSGRGTVFEKKKMFENG